PVDYLDVQSGEQYIEDQDASLSSSGIDIQLRQQIVQRCTDRGDRCQRQENVQHWAVRIFGIAMRNSSPVQVRAASLTGSPAIRLCHMIRGSRISHGVA